MLFEIQISATAGNSFTSFAGGEIERGEIDQVQQFAE